MKKFLYAFALAGALMFALAEQAAAPNFEGTWVLDKSKSEGLTAAYKTFERAKWVITQTEKEISIKEIICRLCCQRSASSSSWAWWWWGTARPTNL